MQLSIFFEIFGTEKTEGALEGMLGSVCQSVFGEGCLTDSRREGRGIALFLINDHPFDDDRKRIATDSLPCVPAEERQVVLIDRKACDYE